jgi:arylsulfatase
MTVVLSIEVVPDRPNVLLVMTDQQAATTLPVYGNPVARTPHLDRLAAGGVVVEQAVCTYPACTPARAAVHTGRYPHTNGVRANHLHLPPHEITLPALLARAGYELALLGKNHVFADGQPISQFRVGGLALRDWPRASADLAAFLPRLTAEETVVDLRSAFDVWERADHFGPSGAGYEDVRAFSLQPPVWRNHAGVATSPIAPERTSSGWLAARAEAFLDEREGAERPWFCWLSFPDPHSPYVAPEPYASMYAPDDVDVPPTDDLARKPERQRLARTMCGMDGDGHEGVVRAARAMSYGMVSAIDDAVGRVLDALDRTGAADNTLVLFLSDHGGYLGEHGAWHKAPAFYDCLIRIPLIVRLPGVLPAGTRLADGFVEQVDLLPTICDVVGIPQPPGVQGRSAAGALAGHEGAAARTIAFSEVGEAGVPITIDEMPYVPSGPLDDRWFPWDGYQESWVGQGKMVRTGSWKYAWWATGEEELYDLAADPHELVNLAHDPSTLDRRRDLRDELLRWTVATEDQLPLHAGNIYLEDAVSGHLPF